MNPKITAEHLRRSAIVYVRQSSIGQVIEHTESKLRQYELAESAKAMGFGTWLPRCRGGDAKANETWNRSAVEERTVGPVTPRVETAPGAGGEDP